MQMIAPDIEHDLLVTVTPRPVELPAACSTLRRIDYLTRRPVPGWIRELTLVFWLLRHIHRYDTIHFRTHVSWYFISYLTAVLFGRRIVLSATLDDSVPVLIDQYRPSLRGLVARMFRLFDGFVSISTKLHQETTSVMPQERCHLLPCGITLPGANIASRASMRAKLGIPEHAIVLIFVGGICARKDPMLLVRMLPELHRTNPDTWLMMVGPVLEQDYLSELQELMRQQGTEAKVIFVGQVADPHPYYAAADIMTFASQREGFGTVVPEGQVNGLPVVVRHLPGVNDLFVDDGRTGFFFTDDAGYLRAVRPLIVDADLRRKIGEDAREFVRQNFDMTNVARRYLSIYGYDMDPVANDMTGMPEATRRKWRASIPAIGNDASIVNPRFFNIADTSRLDAPVLMTVIDAEEEFDWSAPFSRNSTGVSSMRCQGPAQRIFERYGVVPTYMVDFPVISQNDGTAPLLDMLKDGRCDVGTQLHAWVNPPFDEHVNNFHSFPGNLPPALEFEKIKVLTSTIEEATGIRPRLYRAGRYGVGPRTADILKALGYLADSSVVPSWNFVRQGGPDFRDVPSVPYWVDMDRRLLEIPCSAGIVGHLARIGPMRNMVFSGTGERIGLPSIPSRLRLMERIKLSPEGITVDEAKRLIRHLVQNGQKVFVLSYHTPSLVPGNTPYVRTSNDLTRFLAWLEEVLAFFAEEVGGRFETWANVRNLLLADRGDAVAARSAR